jgi:GNAT superfamily N-acetyltransferase
MTTPPELADDRREIRPLLSSSAPGDALAVYYALHHDPRRTQLTVHRAPDGRADGFLVVAQTGVDLFRPLVTLRAPTEAVAGELFQAGLTAGRPYSVVAPLRLAGATRAFLDVEQMGTQRILMLDASRFQPIINVLVTLTQDASGEIRFQIASQGRAMAVAGVNWRSPDFAEVYVYAEPAAQGRGWAKSVVSACTQHLLGERVRPLYVVREDDARSARLAEGLGYVDTGEREFTCHATLQPHPRQGGEA